MRRVPPFSWSALIFSLGVILVMPVLVGTLAYLFLDHRNARTGFGGNEGIFVWIGWIVTQPRHVPLRHPGDRHARRAGPGRVRTPHARRAACCSAGSP